jgi:hypothetical protein
MEELLLSEMRRLEDPWRLWDQPDDGLAPPQSRKKGKKSRNPKPGEKKKKAGKTEKP